MDKEQIGLRLDTLERMIQETRDPKKLKALNEAYEKLLFRWAAIDLANDEKLFPK
jgi:hypothetical protein